MSDEQTVIVKKIVEGPVYQDSLEIGTASKGGGLKIYFDASDLEDAERRLENAVKLREKAREMML